MSWPDGARLAVNVVINFEEGAELSTAAGDEANETMSEPVWSVSNTGRDLLTESVYDYGTRRGVWRVLEVLDDAGVPATVFACGRSVEVCPEVASAFADRDYDFVGHGYRWAPQPMAGFDEVREDIRRTASAIDRVVGKPMLGWFSRSPVGPAARRAAVAEGLLYDSMTCADDRPGLVDVDGTPFLTVPYTTDVNDIRYWRGNLATGDDFARYGQDTFDGLSAIARTGPDSARDAADDDVMMSIGVHPRMLGRPGRIDGLRRLLAYIGSRDGVWFARRGDIARRWLSRRSDQPNPGPEAT